MFWVLRRNAGTGRCPWRSQPVRHFLKRAAEDLNYASKIHAKNEAQKQSEQDWRNDPSQGSSSPMLSRAEFEPPLAVRAGLVGGATALLTPLFPVFGLNQLMFRYVPGPVRLAITGGTTMLYFSAMTLAPNAFYFAPLLLPFAIGNAATAACVYLAAELAVGSPQKLAALKFGRVPLAGPVIGMITALISPFTFPGVWVLLWGDSGELQAFDIETMQSIYALCFNWVMTPCLLTTGFVGGGLIHVFLRPIILGVPAWHWTKLAGVVGGGLAVVLVWLYSASLRTDVEHLRDVTYDSHARWSFLGLKPCFVHSVRELQYIPALDHASGAVVSENVGNGKQERDITKAADSELLRKKAAKHGAPVYTSKTAGYFAGMPWGPKIDSKEIVEPSEVAALTSSLHIGETIVTDACVVLAAGTAPASVVTENLTSLLPWIANSSFADRNRTWSFVRQQALVPDLQVRSAQLRELVRLRQGSAPGPFSAEQLQAELCKAGVMLERAQAGMQEVGWTGQQLGDVPRETDWALLGNTKAKQQKQSLQVGALWLGGVTAVGLAGYIAFAR